MRMTRVLFLGTAIFGVAFSALAVRSIMAQWPLLDPVYAVGLVVTLAVSPLALAVLAPWAPLSTLRIFGVAYMIVYATAIVTWPIAMTVDRIPDGSQPWIINLLPMAIFSGAIVLSEVGTWVFLVAMCLAAGALRYVADGGTSLSIPIQDTLFNSMTITVFVAVEIVTRRAGRQRDETARRTAMNAMVAAASEAQDLQRARVAALTHDDVISTLVAAARSTDATGTLVRRYATRALDRLEALSADDDDVNQRVSSEELVASLRDTVSALSTDVRFAAPPPPPLSIPGVVLRTLTEATAEAVRNSIRHAAATDPVDRAVVVEVTPELVTVEIRDDGTGFDPRTVPGDRFGVRFSISHRMSLIEGGSATIDTAPGSGTRVLLSWRPDDDA
jgi:signal transduction histidine kinase